MTEILILKGLGLGVMDRVHMVSNVLIHAALNIDNMSLNSYVTVQNYMGPRMDPCGTPQLKTSCRREFLNRNVRIL